MQSRNRDTDVESKHMDTKGGSWESAMDWKPGTDTYTPLCMKKTMRRHCKAQRTLLGALL